MNNNDKFIIQDNFGNKINAEYIMRFVVNDNEYILYNIEKDSQNVDVCVARVMYDQYGNEMFLSLNDYLEEKRISSLVGYMINKVR